METLVVNLTGKVRRETLGGREYLVAPATLLVPGVLDGSQGPLLYTLDDIQQDPARWNGMPIVVGHPYEGGLEISARRPDVLDSQGIGYVFNAQVNGKLSADLWFDVERTRKVDERIIGALEQSKPIELSTGLLTSNEPSEGTYNGKRYTSIARNHSPDHLAILLDSEGACSMRDGCGVLMNEDGKALLKRLSEFLGLSSNEKHKHFKTEGGKQFPGSDFAFVPDPAKPSTWKLRLTNSPGGTPDSGIVGAAVAALGKGFRGNKVQIPSGALAGVKSKVRAAWLKANPNKSKEDLPSVVNEEANMPEMTEPERKELVDNIITNCDCWKEDHREVLNALNDDDLKGWGQHVEKEKQTVLVANAARKGFEDQQGNSHVFNEKTGKWDTKPKEQDTNPGSGKLLDSINPDQLEEGDSFEQVLVGNVLKYRIKRSEAKPQTANEWFKTAPAEIQSAVRNAMDIETREKFQIIEQMTANVADDSKERVVKRLQSKPLDELRDLSALASKETEQASSPNYFGAAVPASNELAQDDKNDILPLPTMNWGQKDKQKQA